MKNSFYSIGTFGDTIYSLCVFKMLGGGDCYIKLNGINEQSRRLFGHDPVSCHKDRYTQADADFIMPLLKAQDYLDTVDIYTGQPCNISFQDHWRMHLISGWKGNQTECYALTQGMDIHDPENHKKLILEPWLTPLNPIRIPGRPVVVNRTDRFLFGCKGDQYKEWVNFGLGDYGIFVGTRQEHDAFENEFKVKILYQQVSDMLELARIIQGCEQFMGNQSMALSIAIGLGKTFYCEIRKDFEAIRSPHGLGDVWFPRVNGHYF